MPPDVGVLLGQDGDGALCHRIGDEPAPVRLGPAQRGEQPAGLHLAAVGRQSGDVDPVAAGAVPPSPGRQAWRGSSGLDPGLLLAGRPRLQPARYRFLLRLVAGRQTAHRRCRCAPPPGAAARQAAARCARRCGPSIGAALTPAVIGRPSRACPAARTASRSHVARRVHGEARQERGDHRLLAVAAAPRHLGRAGLAADAVALAPPRAARCPPCG